MKVPVSPLPFGQLLDLHASEFGKLLRLRIGPEVRGRYEHYEFARAVREAAASGIAEK